jgi:purine-nucleoside phosphorylase
VSYLRPTAEIHADALLPGDPGRALALAQELLEQPKMSNHARGLWGYSGHSADGGPLTIQATGIGGPSAAVVLRELADLGVRRAVRVGTGRAQAREPGPGPLMVVTEALAADGVSRALGVEGSVFPDPELGQAVMVSAAEEGAYTGRVVTTDLEGDPDGTEAAAFDLTTAPLMVLGERLGVAVASLLVVRGATAADPDPIDDEALALASLKLGRSAVSAMAAISS